MAFSGYGPEMLKSLSLQIRVSHYKALLAKVARASNSDLRDSKEAIMSNKLSALTKMLCVYAFQSNSTHSLLGTWNVATITKGLIYKLYLISMNLTLNVWLMVFIPYSMAGSYQNCPLRCLCQEHWHSDAKVTTILACYTLHYITFESSYQAYEELLMELLTFFIEEQYLVLLKKYLFRPLPA